MIGNTTINQTQPPFCFKHRRYMRLCFWERPGSGPGNGWSCDWCAAERESIESGSLEFVPTRFPEGAEL